MVVGKVCRLCGIEKPRNAFYVHYLSRDGLAARCKQCVKAAKALPAEGKTKVCRRCGEEMSYGEFHANPRTQDGFASVCKACVRERGRALYIQRKYEITQGEYDALFEKQAGVCAICGEKGRTMVAKSGPRKRAPRVFVAPLFVDHDHKTGSVRGLLCSDCNVGIGAFRDRVDVLESAITYLARHS